MVKTSSMIVIGVPDGEERDNGLKVIFKEMAENCPKMMKDIKP